MISRREALGALAGAAGVSTAVSDRTVIAAPTTFGLGAEHGRLKQSVCRWPYAHTPLPELCRRARQIGFSAIDLLFPDEWAIAHDAGLAVSLGYPSRRDRFIETGFNDPANHELLITELQSVLPLAARARIPSVIGMFGNRVPGVDDTVAAAHCVAGLRRIAPLAEVHGVNLCLELLNSKVNHPGYQGDHTAFGVAVVQAVGSPRVKLLYDIYHMQIMEGDIIRTIGKNIEWIGHFHTGGVPDRHEIDDSQELNFRAIARTIADLKFAGYLAHEFIPTHSDPFGSLQEAYQLCNI